MAITRGQIRKLSLEAKEGSRLVVDGKTIWAGLGNRSGLHSFAYTLLGDKWNKSGKGLIKKLIALPDGAKVEVQLFHNKTRDRGSWVHSHSVNVDNTPAPECYHLTVGKFGDCEACGKALDDTVYSLI